MTLAELADLGFLIVAIVGPILLVLRWGQLGVLLGTVFAWVALIVAGDVLSALDPSREGALLDSTWALFGWVGTLAYSSIVYLAVRVIKALWERRAGRRERARGER